MLDQINSVLSIAQNEVGYLEKKSNAYLDDKTANAGYNNYTKYWRDMKPSWQTQSWCNCFVNWCFTEAFGSQEAKKLLYTPDAWSYYTPTSAQYFKDNKAWYSTPKAGDIIYFKNDKRIHHIGIVRAVSNSRVYTIEGNTSGGKTVIANGGGVFAKNYSLKDSDIAGYGRPNYNTSNINYIEDSISTGREGLVITASSLNIRQDPSASSKIIGSIKKGESIFPTIKTTINGSYWFKAKNGWVSGSYLTGWIYQLNKWWYLDSGKVIANCTYVIDGKTYVFDEDGWMITSDRINANGELT